MTSGVGLCRHSLAQTFEYTFAIAEHILATTRERESSEENATSMQHPSSFVATKDAEATATNRMAALYVDRSVDDDAPDEQLAAAKKAVLSGLATVSPLVSLLCLLRNHRIRVTSFLVM